MSRRPSRVTQADIARAIRAADQCGSGRVIEITTDGTILILPAREGAGGRQVAKAPSLDDDSPIEL